MSDNNIYNMKRCEIMVKLLCKASSLKDDDCRLRSKTVGSRMCIRCDLGAPENATHMIMQCPENVHAGVCLNTEISEIAPNIDPQEFLNIVLGKSIDGWSYEQMEPIWEISARYVTKMYFDTLKARQALG